LSADCNGLSNMFTATLYSNSRTQHAMMKKDQMNGSNYYDWLAVVHVCFNIMATCTYRHTLFSV